MLTEMIQHMKLKMSYCRLILQINRFEIQAVLSAYQ